MRSRSHPLVALLRDPSAAARLSAEQWRDVLAVAQNTKLAAKVYLLTQAYTLPAQVTARLAEQAPRVEHQARAARFEIGEIARAFRGSGIDAMLLKGGAYVAADLEVASGRGFSDFDVMVPLHQLADAERLLGEKGWASAPKSELDKQYFREWLHEIAPLLHRTRNTTLDLHHNILPPTDRLHFDARTLWDQAVELDCGLWVLSPIDRVLHSAAHLFRNGEFRNGLRDLYDMHGLLADIDRLSLWDDLLARARQTGLTFPCALCLRYVNLLFDTEIPAPVAQHVARWLPAALRLGFDYLVDNALVNRFRFRADVRRQAAIAVLAYWPVPRMKVMTTWLFWAKRVKVA